MDLKEFYEARERNEREGYALEYLDFDELFRIAAEAYSYEMESEGY